MVVFTIGRLTDFVKELTMSMNRKSSLQQAERAMISASIVDKAVLSVALIAIRQGILQK
jgi:hypothetical protein